MSENRAGRIILLYSAENGMPAGAAEEPETPRPYLSALPAGDDAELLRFWLREVFAACRASHIYGSGDISEWDQTTTWDDAFSRSLQAVGIRGKVLAEGLSADLFVCHECDSTFDIGWELAKHGTLSEWGAVLAMRQRSGRGQMRREWHSPAGNLHVSFRLPEKFLKMEAASVLTASLMVEAFARLGLDLALKWPNDLVMHSGTGRGKLGGVLLEERGGMLLAGLGLNCAHCPEESAMRKDAAMKAVTLLQSFTPKTPISLWLELVQNMILLYVKTFQTTPTALLLRQSEKYLLWKGSEVQVRDHNDSGSAVTGILCGLTELGGLRLLVPRQNASPDEALAEGQFGSPGFPGHFFQPEGQRSGSPNRAAGSRKPFGFEELELYSGSLKGTD